MNSNLFDLTGRVALVTGTSRGLGQYMGRALARAGADLVIASRKLADLEPFQAEVESLGRKAYPVELDVRNYDSIQSAVARAVEHYGRIDILVNNAGLNVRKPAIEISWDEWNLVLETNLRGEFFVAQAVARDSMIPRKYGRIINIGSVTSVFGYAGLTPYCASRGGVKQMTMSLADDWGRHGITVNCLAPGWFRTAQNSVLYENKEWLDYIVDRIPMKRPGAPKDLDAAVVFLASEASEYYTGQTMLVDGGISTGATRATVAPKQ
ncbi:MAG: SDR family oxidoreductase [Acidobacteriota bacterium]|nr:SDR family oxidoreductase [Acidobacteriota bacterium]